MKKSFTLVELMIVIAILAILSAIVIFTLNPSRLFDNFKDTRRVSDISSIHKAINFMETWSNGIAYGTSTYVYISIPATNADCSDIAGLPVLPAGYTYACSSQTNYKKTDGSGWIPINFTVLNENRYLSSLPVDPVNNNIFFYTYFPGGSYELSALLKNPNTNSINSEGSMTGAFTVGSPNRTKETPLSRDTSLVGHWKLNEGSGTTAYDSSGYGNHGALIDGPTWSILTNGKNILSFDGTNDYVDCGKNSSLDLSNNGTVVFWAKIDSYDHSQYWHIFGKGGSAGWDTSGYSIWYYNNQNKMMGSIADRSKSPNSNNISFGKPTTGSWNHWSLIWNGNRVTSYLNGALVESMVQTISVPVTSYNFFLSKTPPRYFWGSSSDVRVYNRALSTSEIFQIYNVTKYNFQ